MNTTKLELTIKLTQLNKLSSLKELIKVTTLTVAGTIFYTGFFWCAGNLIR
jgi:hypothetical protein